MLTTKMAGVITPILTPFDDDLKFQPDLYLEHAGWLLYHGVSGIVPFGTTGEALSMSVQERLDAVDVLIDGGIDPGYLMPGAGLCNLPETVMLCRQVAERGCAAALTLPPFFYKNASDDGLFQYFVELIDTVNHPGLKICLYHIPPMVGIGFSPSLAAQLSSEFPDVVVAYKDSSGDLENTRAVLKAAPGMAVFPGSERFLREGLECGAMGCISATCNTNPAGIREVYDIAIGRRRGNLGQAEEKMIHYRNSVEGYAPIPAMKGLLATQNQDPRWGNVRPPLVPATHKDMIVLVHTIYRCLGELPESMRSTGVEAGNREIQY